MAGAPAPLILTLRLDEVGFERLDALRQAHFPAAINHLRAHLTLFHHLPGDAGEDVREAVLAAAAGPPFPLRYVALRSLGRGVAVEVESRDLMRLRAELAARFRTRLTPQDAQGFRPHVTLQNKVAPETARALKAELEPGWSPWEGRGEGLLLHRYLGGPWALDLEAPMRG